LYTSNSANFFCLSVNMGVLVILDFYRTNMYKSIVRIILILILLSGCVKDFDFNPFTTFLRVVHKGQFDETRVETLEINQEKHTQNSVD
jgi:hypothetical protein